MINLPFIYTDKDTQETFWRDSYYPASRILKVSRINEEGTLYEKGFRAVVFMEGPNPHPFGQGERERSHKVHTPLDAWEIVKELENLDD